MFESPLTFDQLQDIQQEIEQMQQCAHVLKTLLTGAYGEADQRATRALEVEAAIQRLRWAMERSAEPKAAGAS